MLIKRYILRRLIVLDIDAKSNWLQKDTNRETVALRVLCESSLSTSGWCISYL
jgi:hypothetical protein